MNSQGAVSAATPQAREVGRAILESGGNAFDAVVASAIALAVTEPGNSGLGGEGYCIFYEAQAARAGALCFMSTPGSLSTPTNLRGRDLVRGVMGSLVPAAVAGWFRLISEKCTRPAEELIAPSIEFAENGFDLTDGLAGALNWMAGQFHDSARPIFVRPDRPWQERDRLLQPELGKTLRLLARDGERAFYEGEFAQRMDEFFRATGGLLRKGDLAGFRPSWQNTLARRFGEVEVHVPPPESTGFSLFYGLELLSRLGYGSMAFGEPRAIATLVSVLRETDECVDGMAARLGPYEPETEDAIARMLEEGELEKTARRLERSQARGRRHRGTCTTSLSACDGSGNLVCLTQTLDHGFGSGVVIPGTGVLMNDGMAWLNIDPSTGRADLVAPHRRHFVPVVPTVALGGSARPWLALGTPGGFGIPQTTLQVWANILLRGDTVQEAIDRPRITVGPIVPEHGCPEDVQLEAGFAPEAYEEWPIEPDQGYQNFGRFHAVQITDDGEAVAIRDPRV